MLKKIQENVWQLTFKQFGSLVYLVKLENKWLLVDTSSIKNRQELIENLKEMKIVPENINIILLTHLHFDHSGNISLFKKSKIYASSAEIDDLKKEPEKAVVNEESLKEIEINKILPLEDFKNTNFKIIFCPGHTKGSVAFLYKDILFSGDTIFDNKGLSIGRTDLATSVPDKMSESVKKLLKLKFKILCPGH